MNLSSDFKKIILLEDVIDKINYGEYYCANVVEKRYDCKKKMTWVKGGGFGLNYRYCQSCYRKWDDDKKKKIVKYEFSNDD